jgi:hypothetical protein
MHEQEKNLKVLGEQAQLKMKVAVKSIMAIWATVSVAGFCGLIYLFPSYSLDNAFSQALRKYPSSELAFWFHWCSTFLLVGSFMTAILYRIYRKQYGRLWKSN